MMDRNDEELQRSLAQVVMESFMLGAIKKDDPFFDEMREQLAQQTIEKKIDAHFEGAELEQN